MPNPTPCVTNPEGGQRAEPPLCNTGGHLNPAVTAAFLMTKKISLIKAALYWIAQLGGAILGSYLVKYVRPCMLCTWLLACWALYRPVSAPAVRLACPAA